MPFKGSLRELPLLDVIQLVAVSGRSGVFSVEDDRVGGKIFLHEGQIVHAEVGGIMGEEAVYELSIWPDGDFRFEPSDSDLPATTIDKSNANLLLEAARRMDEWTILSKRIPSTRMIPVLTGGGQEDFSLNRREWSVIEKIDERRSLEGIALALQESPFEIAKIAFGLVSSQLIELRQHAPFLEPERLANLAPEKIAALTTRIYEEALEKLSDDDSLERLQTLLDRARNLDGHEETVAALVELIRGAQHLLSADRGPEEASSFYDRVEELIGEL